MRLRRPLAALAMTVALLATGCTTTTPSDPGTPSPSATVSPSPLAARASVPTPTASSGSTPGSRPSPTSVGDGPLHLALGDSLAAGFQLATGVDSTRAYPALARAALETGGHPLTLVNIACPGETTTSLIRGGRCEESHDSQLEAAEALLAEQQGSVGLVTIDIGGNDILRCGRRGVDTTCLEQGRAAYEENLPVIMDRLRTAAGPDVVIAVVNYYNPHLPGVPTRTSDAVSDDAAPALARLNASLAEAARRVDATLVDVGPVFRAEDTDIVEQDGVERPRNAAMVCALTWMCVIGDVHLNDVGHAAVAEAVVAAVEPRL